MNKTSLNDILINNHHHNQIVPSSDSNINTNNKSISSISCNNSKKSIEDEENDSKITSDKESKLLSDLNEFDTFSKLNFFRQCNIVKNWFKNINDLDKNNFLNILLEECSPVQKHLISFKFDLPHKNCLQNCCDIVQILPHNVLFKIFSYLDPVSLSRCSKVCKKWNELVNDQLIWKKLCFLPKWRFSEASEVKQIEKYQSNWKCIFAERYRIKKNWLSGKTHIKTFYGHEASVSCVQFDEKRIVAGSSIGVIKVWNISIEPENKSSFQSTLEPYLSLYGHSGTIRCLYLDSSLNRLYSGSADHTIKIWDLSEVHPTWSRVACKMTLLGHTDAVRCMQVNKDILISGSYDKTLKIWDLKTGRCKNTLRGHTDSVLCLQFDDKKIISGSGDKSILIWDFEGRCLAQLVGHNDSVTCIYFDSQRIISGSLDFDIKFWDISNGKCIDTLNWITKEGHRGAIRCLKADSQKIVSCSDDKTIKIWNIETGQRYVTLKNHSDGVTCLEFNDYYILSGSFDRTIKLWDFSIV